MYAPKNGDKALNPNKKPLYKRLATLHELPLRPENADT